MTSRIISLAIGYCIGCIQMAYIIGKLKGIDIREHGSGNAGTTNVLRTLGMKAGVFVFVFDFTKGILAGLISFLIFKDSTVACYAGFGAVLGHNFPAQLQFRGGKGVATSAGFMFLLDYRIAIIVLIYAVVVLYITRYMSVVALSGFVLATILYYYYYGFDEKFVLVILLSLMAFYRHKENIKRLLNGTENKFTVKKTANKAIDNKKDK